MVVTRAEERAQEERLRDLEELPNLPDSQTSSPLSLPPPSPQPIRSKSFLTMSLALPKFDGGEGKAKAFINDFDIAMLDRDVERDDKKAKYFVRCLVPDSRAERWLDRLDEATKASYSLLEAAFKSTFIDVSVTDVSRMNALQQMMKTRLKDADVGRSASNDPTPYHIRYCEEMARLGSKVPVNTHDSTKVAAILSNVGGGLAKTLREERKDTFDGVLDGIRDLSDWQIKDIQHYAMVEQLANASTARSPPPIRQSALPLSPALTDVSLPQERPARRGQQEARYNQGTNQDRFLPITAAHQARIDEWEARFGDVEPSADMNYPLTPGTEQAGTRECYKCGTKRPLNHIARECPNPWVNPKEQSYRYRVSEKKRSMGDRGNSYQNNQNYRSNGYYASGANAVPVPQGIATVGALGFEYDDDDQEGLSWMALQGQGNEEGLGF
ncbi:hypothetical protein FFLO_03288 [Filobasidium floriforme]|uniref:CCHC-type domain-containing protein n=1 Tax=Filobasidium floriforme TaxID=5210 RepID=A0A8K0NQZ9_9TREE|nr:hypothetical protein FFLO_03288 [Filobasidium floriforme]